MRWLYWDWTSMLGESHEANSPAKLTIQPSKLGWKTYTQTPLLHTISWDAWHFITGGMVTLMPLLYMPEWQYMLFSSSKIIFLIITEVNKNYLQSSPNVTKMLLQSSTDQLVYGEIVHQSSKAELHWVNQLSFHDEQAGFCSFGKHSAAT